MNRYKTTKVSQSEITEKRSSTVNKFDTTIYENVPQRDDDMYVITQEGDRLDNLASVFYGNPRYWWYIAHVNNLNTMNVTTGTSLRIPLTVEFAKTK